jgi:DNA-binding MarR family transcriptional regulator
MPRKNTALPRVKKKPLEPERFLGLTVSTLARNVSRSFTMRIEQHGALPGSHAVIAWLMRLPDSTQSELSRLIGVEQPTMALTLGRLERDALIERRPDPEHGRRSRVRLTARGRRISLIMAAAARDLEKVAFKNITQSELDEFFRVAELMSANLSLERPAPKSDEP